jgi:hypothetical protein
LNQIRIPPTVREIGDQAFAHCRHVTRVTFEAESVLTELNFGSETKKDERE